MSPSRLTAAVMLVALASSAPAASNARAVANRVIVRFAQDARRADRDASHALLGTTLKRRFRTVAGLDLVEAPSAQARDAALAAYRARPDVLYAEPDYAVQALGEPDDPAWSQLWNLHNTGQTGGMPGADVGALEAWDVTRGNRDVVVVVIDTGLDYRHADLAANVWRNADDCDANGLDDDGDGFADDCHGIDVVNRDGDPDDDHGHGTHVAGTIGAVGNNGIGVVGVAQAVSIASCKFLDGYGQGYTSDAIACLDWVAGLSDRGVRVVATNNSWGGGGYSQALVDAIAAQRDRGILFVAAAGNDGEDNDLYPHYPAAYDVPNVIAVAATTAADDIAPFSNRGRRRVHVGAPGLDVLSTVPGDEYATKSGTSMAAPHVTGVAALLASANPARDWRALKNLLLSSGDDVPALADTMTGKRVDAYRALTCTDATVLRRTSPEQSELVVTLGQTLHLEVMHVRCADPGGVVTVADAQGAVVTLVDDGTGADAHADDAVYSATWTPAVSGTDLLTFPGGDVVTVRVPAGAGYTVEPVAMAWRNLPGSSLDLADDQAGVVFLPFSISFGGVNRDVLHVSDNGLLSFDASVSSYTNERLPIADRTTLVAPFWDDLVATPGTESNVYVGIAGAAPQRELVVEWRNVVPWSWCADASVWFQAVFFEDRLDVLFQYADVASTAPCAIADGGSATVGIQVDADHATTFSIDEPVLHDGMALRWIPMQAPECLNDVQCDDGVACTLDRCTDGGCTHATDDGGCDDGIGCTIDRCVGGGCTHTPDDGACDDDDTCTHDRCDGSAGCVQDSTSCAACSVVPDGDWYVFVRATPSAVRLGALLRTAEPIVVGKDPIRVSLRDASGTVLFTQVLTNLKVRRGRVRYTNHGPGVRFFATKRTRDGGQRVVVRVALAPGAAWTGALLEIETGQSGCISHTITPMHEEAR